MILIAAISTLSKGNIHPELHQWSVTDIEKLHDERIATNYAGLLRRQIRQAQLQQGQEVGVVSKLT